MIDKIKAEIERRIKEKEVAYDNTPAGNVVAHYFKGEIDSLQALLSFIEALEKERKDKFQEYLKATPAERRKFDLSFLGDKIKLTREELDEICNLPPKDALKIKGWVARNQDGELWIHSELPIRDCGHWEFSGGRFKVDNALFPGLSWRSEPIEVELAVYKI